MCVCAGCGLRVKVLCVEKDSIAPPSVSVVEGERSGALLFGVLEKYTLYALQVLAYTRLGDGPPSGPVLTRTKEDGEPGVYLPITQHPLSRSGCVGVCVGVCGCVWVSVCLCVCVCVCVCVCMCVCVSACVCVCAGV